MRTFAYLRPATLDEALTSLKDYGPEAALLAGGTDLLVRLRRGKAEPTVVIDLKRVHGLSADSTEENGCLRVGALNVLGDLVEDERVRQNFPALVDAANVVGSVQIRNRATLAGNICNASPAADTAPALLVYDAVVQMASIDGQRSAPLADFFTGPGKTILKRGEIVTAVDLPLPTCRAGAAFERLTRRHGVDLATISLCCLAKKSGEVRFAYGAAAPRPLLVQDDSGVLLEGDEEEKDRVLQGLIAATSPISDIRGGRDYRMAMLLTMSHRALRTAADRMRATEKGA